MPTDTPKQKPNREKPVRHLTLSDTTWTRLHEIKDEVKAPSISQTVETVVSLHDKENKPPFKAFKPTDGSLVDFDPDTTYYVSTKHDGIRGIIWGNRIWSRAGKLIPNTCIQRCVAEARLPDGLDGEIVSGSFQDTQSRVMKKDGEPFFQFRVFDIYASGTLKERQKIISELFLDDERPTWMQQIGHQPVLGCYLDRVFHEAVTNGQEGVVVRTDGVYRDGGWKLKPLCSGEAVVTGQIELTRKDGTPGGTLGAWMVVDEVSGVNFRIGTGFTSLERDEFWRCSPASGRLIHYRCQGYTKNGTPRFPRFCGFRDEKDMA